MTKTSIINRQQKSFYTRDDIPRYYDQYNKKEFFDSLTDRFKKHGIIRAVEINNVFPNIIEFYLNDEHIASFCNGQGWITAKCNFFTDIQLLEIKPYIIGSLLSRIEFVEVTF